MSSAGFSEFNYSGDCGFVFGCADGSFHYSDFVLSAIAVKS